MKFKFCGDLDAPDWILKEISILARISSIRIKLLCNQVINHILGGEIDYEKVEKLTKDANFDSSDVKASIAALNFILINASKYDVDQEKLSEELQQLGLPKEHCDSLARPYRDNKQNLRQTAKEKTLSIGSVSDVSWRVDYLLSSNSLNSVNTPSVHLSIKTTNPNENNNNNDETHSFELTSDKFRVMYNGK